MTRKTEEGNGMAIGIAMLLGSIATIAFCIACIYGLVRCVPSEKGEQAVDTIHEVVWDTIPYYYPVPKDSIVINYITEKLPIAIGDSAYSNDSTYRDSIEVVLPITQKHYEDSTFSAWVSGYQPNLDSIKVYQRKEIQIITIHTTERKRWNFGVSGGFGVVYDGQGWHCGPGVNIGVTYSF